MKGTIIRFGTSEERHKKSNSMLKLSELSKDDPLKYYSRMSSLIYYEYNGFYCITFSCRNFGVVTWIEFLEKSKSDLKC